MLNVGALSFFPPSLLGHSNTYGVLVHYFLPICTSEFSIKMKKEFYGRYPLAQASLVLGLKGYASTDQLTY